LIRARKCSRQLGRVAIFLKAEEMTGEIFHRSFFIARSRATTSASRVGRRSNPPLNE